MLAWSFGREEEIKCKNGTSGVNRNTLYFGCSSYMTVCICQNLSKFILKTGDLYADHTSINLIILKPSHEKLAVLKHVPSILLHSSCRKGKSICSLNLGSVMTWPVEYNLKKSTASFSLLRHLHFWNSASKLGGTKQVESPIDIREEAFGLTQIRGTDCSHVRS